MKPTSEMTFSEMATELDTLRGAAGDQVTGEKDRAVYVVDRGWIFAGDTVKPDDEHQLNTIRLERAVWVFRWESVGFAAIVDDPSKADIRKVKPVEIPRDSIIFRIPVKDSWGLK